MESTRYVNKLGWRNKAGRIAWSFVYHTIFRFSPRPCIAWRRTLLRAFGAKMGTGAVVDPSCRIWAPWNLAMDERSCLAFDVDCYNVAPVRIGRHTTVSQYSMLCTASHDLSDPDRALVTAPIVIEAECWVFAGAFIGPGVTMRTGAVAAARAVVVKEIPSWCIFGGNPARFIKNRVLKSPPAESSGIGETADTSRTGSQP